jgi:hypothetical protein
MTEKFSDQSDDATKPQVDETPSKPLRTLEDWQDRAAELEAERDKISTILELAGVKPTDHPNFTHLLGQLSVAHEQIIQFQTEAMEGQFPE